MLGLYPVESAGMRKPNRDYAAGEMIASMREDRGLSRADLVIAMRLANPGDARMHVSERTLARIEDEGAIPTARVKFAIAASLDLVPSQVWGAGRRALVTA